MLRLTGVDHVLWIFLHAGLQLVQRLAVRTMVVSTCKGGDNTVAGGVRSGR
jgi:hypothetical protein